MHILKTAMIVWFFLNDSFEGEYKGAQDPSRDQSGLIPVTYDLKHLSREGKDLASCVPRYGHI